MSKQEKTMSFDQLVDWAAGELLKRLLAGEFRTGVWLVLERAIRWSKEMELERK